MDELKELQKRIRILEDIEAIRNLKAKYCRRNDKKQWDEIGDCFAKDALLEVPPVVRCQGREEIAKFLAESMSSVIVVHQVHHSEIEVTSETTAKGLWGEYDQIIDGRSNATSVAYGYYVEEYIKEDGQWRIKYERIDRIYTQITNVYQAGATGNFSVKGNLQR
jgi:ketosteroid isomerase-like protein